MDSKDVQIEPWAMAAGKITQVKIDNSIYDVSSDAPEDIDPVDVAKKFFNVFVEKPCVETVVSEIEPTKPVRVITAYTGMKYEDPIKKIHNIGIFKSKIVDFYKYTYNNPPYNTNEPGVFRSKDLTSFLYKTHKNITMATATNKQHVYIQYMTQQGWLEQVGGSINKGRIYKWKQPPFNITIPEFDSSFIRNMRQLEMETVREA